jgi:2-isopropylmalate synthase
MSDRVWIFDTTLRDGEQSAGVAFTIAEKLEIAEQLARLRVDVIEAGFPATSAGDMQAVRTIAERVRGVTICALARAVKDDIDRAWEAVRAAEQPRIHVFINASDLQIAHQLRKDRAAVLAQAAAMVAHAARYTKDVEFSPMDATRADPDFLCEIVERCIDAGATTINIPDSVGWALPSEVARLFRRVRERVRDADRARFSFHGHDDLGLATANALAAVTGGARQIEVAVNGIGERAGNTALEEVVMAIRTRGERMGVETGVEPRELWRTSKLVEARAGMVVSWNKAVVGKNAFRHGSGIHQDGVLKRRETWEIMDPREIGVEGGTQLVLGKLSGRHAFRTRVRELGYDPGETDLERAFASFKALADDKVPLQDDDIHRIVRAVLCVPA